MCLVLMILGVILVLLGVILVVLVSYGWKEMSPPILGEGLFWDNYKDFLQTDHKSDNF